MNKIDSMRDNMLNEPDDPYGDDCDDYDDDHPDNGNRW